MKKVNDQSLSEPVIIFFDGVCNLCNGFVDFLIKRDDKGVFLFASLQGKTAKELLSSKHLETLETVILKVDAKLYMQSSAALIAISKLGGFWRLFELALIIPKPIRDFFYRWVSKNRYKWFGKRQACRIPKAKESKKFKA